MKKLIAAALFASVSAGALAQGAYIGGSLGAAKVEGVEDYVNQAQNLAADFGISSRSEYSGSEAAVKLFGGYSFNEYFAIEGGYADLGSHEADITYLGLFSEHNEWDISALFVDAIGKIPVSDSFSLFGKIGYARTKTEYKYSDSFGDSFSINKSKGTTKFGIGGEYTIAKRYGIRAEFERYSDVGSQFDFDPDVNKSSDIDVFSIGFNYKF